MVFQFHLVRIATFLAYVRVIGAILSNLPWMVLSIVLTYFLTWVYQLVLCWFIKVFLHRPLWGFSLCICVVFLFWCCPTNPYCLAFSWKTDLWHFISVLIPCIVIWKILQENKMGQLLGSSHLCSACLRSLHFNSSILRKHLFLPAHTSVNIDWLFCYRQSSLLHFILGIKSSGIHL